MTTPVKLFAPDPSLVKLTRLPGAVLAFNIEGVGRATLTTRQFGWGWRLDAEQRFVTRNMKNTDTRPWGADIALRLGGTVAVYRDSEPYASFGNGGDGDALMYEAARALLIAEYGDGYAVTEVPAQETA